MDSRPSHFTLAFIICKDCQTRPKCFKMFEHEVCLQEEGGLAKTTCGQQCEHRLQHLYSPWTLVMLTVPLCSCSKVGCVEAVNLF